MALYSGNEGKFLPTDQAGQLTDTYRQRKRDVGISEAECVTSEFFGIHNLRKLLAQPGCVGIRVAHAKRREDALGNPTTDGSGRLIPRVVLIGVDADGNELDLVGQDMAGLKDMPDGSGGSQLADGPICPPSCKSST